MDKTKFYRIAFIVMLVLAILSLGSTILGFIVNSTFSTFFLITTIVETIAAILLRIRYKKLLSAKEAAERAIRDAEAFLAEQRAEFLQWLKEQNFICSKTVDNLWLDFTNKQWCKFGTKTLFGFSDVTSVECHKTKIERHDSARASGLVSQFASKTQDVSTYDVHVQTSRMDSPLVVFGCGTSYALANEIKATVQAMIHNES